MPRRVGFMMFLGFVATFILTTGISAGADPTDVQEQEAEVADAQDRLEEMRAEAGAAYESYNNALSELNKLDEEIAGTEEDLEAAGVRLSEAQEQLEQRAAQVYRSENVAFLDVLVNAEDFSEFAARLDLWLTLLGQERDEFEAVLEARNELQTQQEALERQRTQRAEAVDEAAARKEQAENAEADAQALLDSLNGELKAMIEAEQARQIEEARAAAAAAQAVEPASEPVQAVEPASEPVDLTQAEPPTPPADPQADLHVQQAAEERAAAEEAAEERREAAEAARAAAEEAERQAELAEQRAAAREQAAEERQAERAAAEEARREAQERREAAEEARREAELAAVEQAAAEREAQEKRAAELAAQREAERLALQRAAEQEAAEREAAQLAAQREAARQEEREAAELAAQQEAERLARQRAAERAAERAAIEEQVAADPTATGQTTAPEEPTNTAAPRPSAGGSSGGGAAGGASASAVVAEAEKYLGVPYRYGGADPSGFDCSGLTMYVFSKFGISLPHSAAGQYSYGSPGSGAAGDLVFGDYTGSGEIGHVGIATGDGQMINAPYPGTVVRYDPITQQNLVGYRTLL